MSAKKKVLKGELPLTRKSLGAKIFTNYSNCPNSPQTSQIFMLAAAIFLRNVPRACTCRRIMGSFTKIEPRSGKTSAKARKRIYGKRSDDVIISGVFT